MLFQELDLFSAKGNPFEQFGPAVQGPLHRFQKTILLNPFMVSGKQDFRNLLASEINETVFARSERTIKEPARVAKRPTTYAHPETLLTKESIPPAKVSKDRPAPIMPLPPALMATPTP